jgi:4-aminobutyrate aminotransferase-like enzyme
MPAMNISKADIDKGIKIIDKVLSHLK